MAVRFTTPDEKAEIPKAKPFKDLLVLASIQTDRYEYSAMILMNITLIPEGRNVFCEHPNFFMLHCLVLSPLTTQSASKESMEF